MTTCTFCCMIYVLMKSILMLSCYYTIIQKADCIQHVIFDVKYLKQSQRKHQYSLVCDLCVFCMLSLTPIGRQIQHHKTSGPQSPPPSSPFPSSPIQPHHCPLQQATQALRLGHTAPLHPIPILGLHPRLLLIVHLQH